MDPIPRLTMSGVVLDAPDAAELADFYRQLLGWKVHENEPGWVTLARPGDSMLLAFQSEPHYLRPTWPSVTTHQQMMAHLDFKVDDLEAASAHASAQGAALAEFQPQETVRVHLDPAGHPFCLWTGE